MAEQKEQKKQFDLALCIDDEEQYKAVLCGPLTYEYGTRNLHFTRSQRYVKGDINKVNESSNFVQEIDTERYINAFHHNGLDVSNLSIFDSVVKLQLFIFKNESLWSSYISSQESLSSDVVVIVNNENKPIYVLHDAVTSILSKSISFSSLSEYCGGDIKILDKFGTKTKTFGVNNEWIIDITKNRSTFKNGLCYKFSDNDARNRFLRQSFDVALVTDTKNQIRVLLSDVTYIYKDNAISFASCIPYKNGFFQKLKGCGEQKKVFKPKEYRLKQEKNGYKFEEEFCENKCLLFDIREIEEWIEFIEAQTNTEYDAAVISNNDDYQVIFLNKLQINWMEKVILFAEYETFTPKHHGLINKFGKLIKMQPLSTFTINLKKNKEKLKNIFFYRWDMNKPQIEEDITPNIEPKKKKKKKKKDSLIKPSATKKMRRTKSVQTLPKKLNKKETKNMNKTKSCETKSRPSKKKNNKKKGKKGNKLNGKVGKMKKAKSYMAVGYNVKEKAMMNGKEEWDKETKKKVKVVINGSPKNKKGKKKKGINDNDKVWDLYIKRNGSKPKNVYQLQDFARKNKKAKTLSYKEAKELFRERSK